MYETLAIGAGAAWLALFVLCAPPNLVPRGLLGLWHGSGGRSGLSGPAGGPAGTSAVERPALVNLVVTRCRLTGAAYAATILDLAARGHLRSREGDQGILWFDVPPSPPDGSALAAFERLVLDAVSGRLAGPGAAPFEALADVCSADPRGQWDPFEESVRIQARHSGLTMSRVPAAMRWVLRAGALAVATLAYLAVRSRPHAGLGLPFTVGFFALVVPLGSLARLARLDRLTAAGAALAARWNRTPADLAGSAPPDVLAFAVAAGTAPAVPGWSAAGIRDGARSGDQSRTGRPDDSRRPGSAWSSFSGGWRQVKISAAGDQAPSAGVRLAAAAWIGVLSCGAWLLPGLAGLLVPVALLAVAATVAVFGLRAHAVRRRLQRSAEFDGQVIARWTEHRSSGDDEYYVSCVAIDDGQGAWSFEVDGSLDRVALGDLVRVRADPRRMKLISLTVTDSHAGCRPASRLPVPGPLLTAAEIAEVLGTAVAGHQFDIGIGTGVIYTGGGATLSLTIADGRLAAFNAMLGRRFGSPLPGIGDEAWLLNRGRTVIAVAGAVAAKLTLSGGPEGGIRDPSAIAKLAAVAVARLAGQRAPASG